LQTDEIPDSASGQGTNPITGKLHEVNRLAKMARLPDHRFIKQETFLCSKLLCLKRLSLQLSTQRGALVYRSMIMYPLFVPMRFRSKSTVRDWILILQVHKGSAMSARKAGLKIWPLETGLIARADLASERFGRRCATLRLPRSRQSTGRAMFRLNHR